MKHIKKITNGIILICIGIMHCNFGISEAFKKQFDEFSKVNYYKISSGLNELPVQQGITNFETFAAFWFFYTGLLLVPLGLLLHAYERKNKSLPMAFSISYLIFVLIGSYMIPNSGMTIIMLPHALVMLGVTIYKIRRVKS